MTSRTKIILHVDDDARVSQVVATILQDAGHRVVGARSAQEGLRKLRSENPDLLILDISMPGMSGLTLLNQISNPDGTTRVPVLIFTAYAQMVNDDARERVAGMLTKPASGEQITGEVARILGQTQYDAPSSPDTA